MKNSMRQISKLFVMFAVVISVMAIGIAVYLKTMTKPSTIIYPTPTPTQSPELIKKIDSIEISQDQKSILNSETKETIFTIEDAINYLKDSGYFYDPDTFQTTNAKYEGDCFLDATLSNSKQRIVFSSGCLPGDLPQAWIGIYNMPNKCISNSKIACAPSPQPFQFLIGGSGRNFVWSMDDLNITYEANLGLSGMTETRTIDSMTGEILEKMDKTNNTADLKTYMNDKYGFEFKYPAEILKVSKTEKDRIIFESISTDYRYNCSFVEGVDGYISEGAKIQTKSPDPKILPYYLGIIIKDNTENLSLEDWITESIKNNNNGIDLSEPFCTMGFLNQKTVDEDYSDGLGMGFREERIMIGRIPAIDQKVITEGNMGRFVLFKKDNKIFTIATIDANTDDESFNQILSTFKFTEKVTK